MFNSSLVRHLLALALCAVCPMLGACAQKPDPALLHTFLNLLPGDYDNNEQVWQQSEDAIPEAERDTRAHYRIVPASHPALGEHVFLVAKTRRDDSLMPNQPRLLRVLHDSSGPLVRIEGFGLPDVQDATALWREPRRLSEYALGKIRKMASCELSWRSDRQGFSASVPANACPFDFAPDSSQAPTVHTLHLTENALEVHHENASKVYRRARRFNGWMGVAKRRVNPDHEGDGMYFVSGFSIHNEGGYRQVLDDDGRPTGYAIELAQLTYQTTRVPILKLGVIEEATGKTVSYTWASTDASRIGINLRWFQAGLTRKH